MEINLQFYKIKDFSLPHNFLEMYTPKIIREGIRFLGIEDANEIFNILKSCKDNRNYLAQVADINKKRAEFLNRFAIPRGLDKKQYQEILKETQKRIDDIQERERHLDFDEKFFLSMEREDYIAKKLKIKKILEMHEGYGTGNLEKAKEFPIEQLLEFKGGFCNCPFHGPEKTNSAKLYKERNKIHCFGCGIDADSLDVYMKINNVSLSEAIKKLSI